MRDTAGLIHRFLRTEDGTTAIEYGLITALIAVGCIAAFSVMGGGLQAIFGYNDSGAGTAIRAAADVANP